MYEVPEISINKIIENSLSGIFFFIAALIIYLIIRFIKAIQEGHKRRIYRSYNYQKRKREKENRIARKRFQEKTGTNNNYDPEMFSNEPLDFEKAENLKYKAYIQAQWDEINKH